MGDTVQKFYDRTGASYKAEQLKFTKSAALFGILHETIFAVTEFIIILYIVRAIVYGNYIDVGIYMTMTLAFYKADSMLQGMFGLIKQANYLSLNADRIRTFF